MNNVLNSSSDIDPMSVTSNPYYILNNDDLIYQTNNKFNLNYHNHQLFNKSHFMDHLSNKSLGLNMSIFIPNFNPQPQSIYSHSSHSLNWLNQINQNLWNKYLLTSTPMDNSEYFQFVHNLIEPNSFALQDNFLINPNSNDINCFFKYLPINPNLNVFDSLNLNGYSHDNEESNNMLHFLVKFFICIKGLPLNTNISDILMFLQDNWLHVAMHGIHQIYNNQASFKFIIIYNLTIIFVIYFNFDKLKSVFLKLFTKLSKNLKILKIYIYCLLINNIWFQLRNFIKNKKVIL